MSNKIDNSKTRIKKYIAVIALSLFYLISCSSDGGSSPSPSGGVVDPAPVKALTLEGITETSVTVRWSLLMSEGGDVDEDYIVYVGTNDGGSGKVFMYDPSPQVKFMLHTNSGATLPVDGVLKAEVSGLVEDTLYRVVVEAAVSGETTKQSSLLVYTDSTLLANPVKVGEPELNQDRATATVTWEASPGARGYLLHATDKHIQQLGDIPKDIFLVICPPGSLLCDQDSQAGGDVDQLSYTLPLHQGTRYTLAIIPFNFRDLIGLQATDEEGKVRSLTEEILKRIIDETSSLGSRLQDALKTDAEIAHIQVTNAGPPVGLERNPTGTTETTVAVSWEHGDGAEYYFASISNGGMNAVTNIIYRYKPDGEFAEKGFTSFINLTPNTTYTVTVQSFTVITNVTNLGGSVSVSISTTAVEPEHTPPSAVVGLDVDSFTTNQVMLSWTAPTNTGTVYKSNATLSGYVVKYKSGNGAFIEIDDQGQGVRLTAALTAESTTATVIGLEANTAYVFLVAAINSGNQVTADGDAAKVEQTTEVASPENLIEQCIRTTSVDLSWDASPGATSYGVYRDDAEITRVTTTYYTDTGLTAGTSYTYKVRACRGDTCVNDSDPRTITTRTITVSDKSFKGIIESGLVPGSLTGYDERSQEIFSRYRPDACVVAKYLKPGASGDGSSFDKAAGNLREVLEGITSASNRVYAVLLTGGTYQAGKEIAMKNHVAIIGGVNEGLGFSGTTTLDGEGKYRVFRNEGIDSTALFYGVTVTSGFVSPQTTVSNEVSGGGMYNKNSSPSLIGVTFFKNQGGLGGGGMHNTSSSPSLERVTFSGNTASTGGGMRNDNSSPTLDGVTFSGNTASTGGGMRNDNSSPTLDGVTFSGNTATQSGGGMYNEDSSPTLEGVTFSGNTATQSGGGLYNWRSSPILVGVTFSENSVTGSGTGYNGSGGGMYNADSSPSLVGVTFLSNKAFLEGGAIANNSEKSPLIVNGIFWGNTASNGQQFHFFNGGSESENLGIYNSIVEGGTGTLVSGKTYTNINQVGFGSKSRALYFLPMEATPIVISFSNIIDEDPKLLPLADNGGSVLTHAIPSDSPAKDKGLYVKKSGTTFYYSADGTTWYTKPDLTTSANLPGDAEDIIDATGYTRTGIQDLGAYEYR